jgi:hypothetical protein
MPPLAKSSNRGGASSSSFFGFSSLASSFVDSSSSVSRASVKDTGLFPSQHHVTVVADHNISHHHPYEQQQSNNADYKAKNALAKLQGSLAAMLSFLSHHGLSPASVKELENALYCNSDDISSNAHQYLTLMKRLEEYLLIFCLDHGNAATSSSPANPAAAAAESPESEAAIFLLLSAWQALCHHVNILHRQAHRDFTRLQSQPRRPRGLRHGVAAAPYQQRQQQQQQHQPHHHQQSNVGTYTTTTIATTMQQPFSMSNSSNSNKELVRTSLIRLAEHSCDCQKGYLLAQRQWKCKNVSI